MGNGRIGEVKGGQGREEEETSKGWFTPLCPKSWKIPWLQNWSDWWGRQRRGLPRAANTPAPTATRRSYTVSVETLIIVWTTNVKRAIHTFDLVLCTEQWTKRNARRVGAFGRLQFAPCQCFYCQRDQLHGLESGDPRWWLTMSVSNRN